MATTGSKPTKVSSFHFRDLTEAFAVDVKSAENRLEGDLVLRKVSDIIHEHEFAYVTQEPHDNLIVLIITSHNKPLLGCKLMNSARDCKPEEAIEILEKLHGNYLVIDEWEGLGHVTHIEKGKHGVSVAADKSFHNVINIKLAKVGVVGGLEIIEAARTSGLDMMIAAGFGCFKYIDLDTPLLLSKDPVLEGYEGEACKSLMDNRWLADIFLSRFCLVRTL
ncbi:L-Ala-D/L-amino acid epimerase [Salix suchowensis]|nr:L-Ala-D/L-amino acid epimerase [Salix suchowensis]